MPSMVAAGGAVAMPRKLQDYLRLRGVRYGEMPPDEAATSAEAARVSHLGGRGLATVVVVRAGKGEWLLAVLPAPLHLDLPALSLVVGKARLRLASPGDVKRRFGPTPPTPFGEMSGLP